MRLEIDQRVNSRGTKLLSMSLRSVNLAAGAFFIILAIVTGMGSVSLGNY